MRQRNRQTSKVRVLWALGATIVQAPRQELPGIGEEQEGEIMDKQLDCTVEVVMGDDEGLMSHCKVLIFTLGEVEPVGRGG